MVADLAFRPSRIATVSAMDAVELELRMVGSLSADSKYLGATNASFHVPTGDGKTNRFTGVLAFSDEAMHAVLAPDLVLTFAWDGSILKTEPFSDLGGWGYTDWMLYYCHSVKEYLAVHKAGAPEAANALLTLGSIAVIEDEPHG